MKKNMEKPAVPKEITKESLSSYVMNLIDYYTSLHIPCLYRLNNNAEDIAIVSVLGNLKYDLKEVMGENFTN